MNGLFDTNISLLEPEHKYLLASAPDIEFKSVTGVVGEYFKPFDKDAIAHKLISSYKKYKGMDPEELIRKWDAAAEHGTKVHKEIESFILNHEAPAEPKAKRAVDWLEKYQDNDDKEIYPEIIVYSRDLRIAGSIDLVILDKGSNSYEIFDWKTAKEIDKQSFNNKMGTHSITRQLMDCRFVHYSLQLSFYRYIMETYYGLKVDKHTIAHLTDLTCTEYAGDYLKPEVEQIILDQNN